MSFNISSLVKTVFIAAVLFATGTAYADRVILMPSDGVSVDALVKKHGGKSHKALHENSRMQLVEVPVGKAKAIAKAMSQDKQVEFAEVDELHAPDLVPNDPYFTSAWHLTKMGAPAAWDLSMGASVTVAILDSGVSNNPDLVANMVAGWNVYDNNALTDDVAGHGTMVAGVVAAVTNNGIGVSSVAGAAKIMPIRVTLLNGNAYTSTIANGVYYAADHGARVANASFQVAGSATIQTAGQYLRSKGGLLVVSAGNANSLDSTAASIYVVNVSATDSTDARASFSNWGPSVDVSAPGVNIWTTSKNGTYNYQSGTSFAAPCAAGVLALIFSAKPTLTPPGALLILQNTATDLGTVGWDQYYGSGRIDADKAVRSAKGLL